MIPFHKIEQLRSGESIGATGSIRTTVLLVVRIHCHGMFNNKEYIGAVAGYFILWNHTPVPSRYSFISHQHWIL